MKKRRIGNFKTHRLNGWNEQTQPYGVEKQIMLRGTGIKNLWRAIISKRIQHTEIIVKVLKYCDGISYLYRKDIQKENDPISH